MLFIISWRNIWRNKKRTLVLISAVTVGVWSMLFLGSLMRGMQAQLVRNATSFFTGHIQIHKKGYREDPVVENSIESPESIIPVLKENLPPGSHWAERVKVPGMASNAYGASGVIIVGIDPGREKAVSSLQILIRNGEYLRPGDTRGIIVGHALAEDFKTRIGKKIVLTAQDLNGNIASRAFRIRGIFYADTETQEKTFVFIPLRAAQEMLKMGNEISEIAILLPDYKRAHGVTGTLKRLIPRYEIHTWKELLPVTVAMLKMYDFFIWIWYIVAFIAMAFGILNTTIISIMERTREFNLMQALGMKPGWIIGGILIESAFILSIGMLSGNVTGLLSSSYLDKVGLDLSIFSRGAQFFGLPRIIYPSLLPKDIVIANIIVFVLGTIVNIYPAWRITRLNIVKALSRV